VSARGRALTRLASGYRCTLASPPGRLAIEKEMMAVAPLAEAIKRAPAVRGRGWDRAGLRPEPAATRSRACGQQGMTSSREMAKDAVVIAQSYGITASTAFADGRGPGGLADEERQFVACPVFGEEAF